MAKDILGRQTSTYGGSFAADQLKVTFPALIGGAGSEMGVLLQNMNWAIQQQVTRLFELGSNATYLVSGRASGQAQTQRIIGPKRLTKEFYQTYGDVCRARTNTLQFSVTTGCDGDDEGDTTSYTCHFVVITSLGGSVNVQDTLVSESMQFMFSSLLYD